MAGSRKAGESHEGPRATPEKRWEESTAAEPKPDELVEEDIPDLDAMPELDETGTDLTGALERGVRKERERVAEQPT